MLSSLRASPGQSLRRFLPWAAGFGTFLALMFAGMSRIQLPLPRELTLQLKFPAGRAGRIEPLVSAGTAGAADFIAINYVDATTATFSYDYWGFGGPASARITFQPGKVHTLRIAMPAFTATTAAIPKGGERAPLRLEFDGREILAQDVPFHPRTGVSIFFGENPVGGTTMGGQFGGTIFTVDHRKVRGSPAPFFARSELFLPWISSRPGEALAFALLGILAFFVSGWLIRQVAALRATVAFAPEVPFAGHAKPPHAWFIGTAALCALAFAYIVTDGTFRFIFLESFGNFYDYQASSLLHGRLDVPESALNGEAFIFEGKVYGYFGPTPALLRIPFVLLGVGFGQLSRSAMLLYYVVTLLGAYFLLRHAMRQWRPARPEPAAWETILFTAHVGLGSTLFFLGSRAYIYHEAILCGVMFAVWSCWCSFRFLAAPASRWWLGALSLGVLSIHARPPAGLFALLFLAGCALLPAWPLFRARAFMLLRRPFAIAVLAGIGVLSFNALSYAKFHTIEGCPLRLNVQYNPDRLAKIDAKQFHLSNIPYGLDTYFLHPQLVNRAHFPWLFFGEVLSPEKYPEAKLDLPDYTMAFPLGMTGLFLLSTIGCIGAAWRQPAAAVAVGALWVAFIPLTLALCAAIATAERYTGDFLAFFVCAGAVGLAFSGWDRFGRALLVIATIWSCALTFALTLHYQGQMVWGVPDEVPKHYLQLRDRIDRFFGVSSP